jgi:hypothetical protein
MRARSTRLAGSVRERAIVSSWDCSSGPIEISMTRRGAAMLATIIMTTRPTRRTVTQGIRHIGWESGNRCTSWLGAQAAQAIVLVVDTDPAR